MALEIFAVLHFYYFEMFKEVNQKPIAWLSAILPIATAAAIQVNLKIIKNTFMITNAKQLKK